MKTSSSTSSCEKCGKSISVTQIANSVENLGYALCPDCTIERQGANVRSYQTMLNKVLGGKDISKKPNPNRW